MNKSNRQFCEIHKLHYKCINVNKKNKVKNIKTNDFKSIKNK